MDRRYVDCREIPSDTRCTIAIAADSDEELLEAAVQQLRALGADALWANGRDGALGFYQRLVDRLLEHGRGLATASSQDGDVGRSDGREGPRRGCGRKSHQRRMRSSASPRRTRLSAKRVCASSGSPTRRRRRP